MRRNRTTKRIAVVEIDDAINDVNVNWQNILDSTQDEVARAVHVPDVLQPYNRQYSLSAADSLQQSYGGRAADHWARNSGAGEVAFSTVAVDNIVSIKNDVEGAFLCAKAVIAKYRESNIELESTLAETERYRLEAGLRVEELTLENEELELVLLSQGHNDRKERRRRGHNPSTSGHRDDRTKEDLWKDLLRNDDSGNAEEDSLAVDETTWRAQHLFAAIKRILPLERDVLRVRSIMGGPVGAYYTFVRTIIATFVVLALVSSFAALLHLTNTDGSLWAVTTTMILFLPEFFYLSSFSKAEGPLFLGLVLLNISLLICIALAQMVQEDKIAKYFEESKRKDERIHCDIILVGWDNSLAGSTAAENASSAATEARIAACRDLVEIAKSKGRKAHDRGPKHLILGLKRLCGALCYLFFQATCYLVLSYLTTADFTVGSTGSTLYQVVRIATIPFIISLYNNIFPYVIRLITKLETWESSAELWVLTARLYISVMANIVIIGLSYGLLADPVLMATESISIARLRLEQEFFPDTFICRLNQAGGGMALNIVIDISVYIVFNLLLHPTRKLCAAVFLYDYQPLEFNLANCVISMIYFVGLLVMSVPFIPLLLVIMPFLLFVRFKFDVFVALKLCSKPVSSIPASQVRRIFSVFLFITVSFVGICGICFLYASRTLPKTCAIQDRSVGLCVDEIDAMSNICTLDLKSPYYKLYRDKNYCQGGYPSCICSQNQICGPFVDEYAAIDPLRRYSKGNEYLALLWYLVAEGSAGAWLVLLVIFVVFAFRTNSFLITKGVKEEKEKQLSQQVESVLQDIQKQNKIINRAKEL